MNSRAIIGTSLILFGIGFLTDFPIFSTVFAIFLIYLGVRLISGKHQGNLFPKSKKSKTSSQENRISQVMIFSGSHHSNNSQAFEGGELVTVFAESHLDLRKAKCASDKISLELVSVFGNLKVRIPSDWAVSISGAGILGTFSSHALQPKKPACTVRIEGVAVLGVIDISN